MKNKEDILNSLSDWIKYVCEQKDLATPEMISALPEVTKSFKELYYSPSPARKL